MKIRILTVILLFTSLSGVGQIKGIVADEKSKAVIPYINIWVENESTGTTSGEDGKFYIPSIENTKKLTFTAIGYETKTVGVTTFVDTVYLKPKSIQISEVTVAAKKNSKRLKVGRYDKSKINFYFGAGTSPWVVARFFPYKKEYAEVEFMQKIKLLTSSDVSNSMFNVRLYTVGTDGKPADYLYDQNIIGIARKGKRSTEIDIADLNIRFPESGFFVAIEWLIIDRNRHEYKVSKHLKSSSIDSNIRSTRVSYQPAIGTVPSDTDENSWIMTKGKWSKIFPNRSNNERYRDKYSLLAIELTLTN